MAQIAKGNQFVEDVYGVRRLVKDGDIVPPGMFGHDAVQAEDVDKRSLALPVVDEEAAKSHADRTGDESSVRKPDEGVSFERVKELRAASRKSSGGEGNEAKREAEEPKRKGS